MRIGLAAALVVFSVPTAAQLQLEEVIVTAQKRAESIQEVPIAVTAFDMSELTARQINTFSDLQFNTPSVNFSKGNFEASNFQIRGIGRTLIAASSDSGVGIHVNNAPIFSSRLYETEYYDIEQVEILRGPQGTLQGRNSTGGTVNMLTRKPEADFGTGFDLEYGDYDHQRVTGHLNIPMGDKFAARFSAIWLQREGYTENIWDGSDVDGRDQDSWRLALQWTPSEDTTIDLMYSRFDEDSTRSRSQKQMCDNDPTALLGCLPDKLDFENPNPSSQFAANVASTSVLQVLGLFEFGSELVNQTSVNPADMRKVNADFNPTYRAEEDMVTLEIEHSTDNYTWDFIASYQDTSIFSQQDYLWNSTTSPFSPSAFLPLLMPQNYAALYADGGLPISAITANNTGVIGGNILEYSNGLQAYDQSAGYIDQYTVELNLASDFDNRLNFVVGGFYMDVDYSSEYYVVSTAFDYFATVFPVSLGQDGVGWVTPYFKSETDRYTLESAALFGELYYEISDNLKLTFGLRQTQDKKKIQQRQFLLNLDDTGSAILYALGQDEPVPVEPDRFDDEWNELNYRLVLDWMPEWEATDSTLVYASISRGYKGGGFNPPFDAQIFPDTPQSFDPEFVDAIEMGTKNTFGDSRYQLALTGFYYDYEGLQVSKIVNRTSFNENTDARIYGAEMEFLAVPNEHWRLNAGVSWIKTKVVDFQSVDPRDPTGGSSDATLIKDVFFSENCVIHHNGAPDPLTAGLIDTQFESCASIGTFVALSERLPAPYTVSEGVAQDLDGNELQTTPELTVSLGVQYNHQFDSGYLLSGRVDYYWQDDMWARNFNRDPVDRIDSWDIWNVQVTLTSPDERWYLKAWARNLEDEDNITGQYLSSSSSGLFTNLFLVPPRTVGVGFGWKM